MDLYLLFRTIKGLKYKLGAHVNNLKMPRDHFKLLMWLWEDIGFQQFKKKGLFWKIRRSKCQTNTWMKNSFGAFLLCVYVIFKAPAPERTLSQTKAEKISLIFVPTFPCQHSFRTCPGSSAGGTFSKPVGLLHKCWWVFFTDRLKPYEWTLSHERTENNIYQTKSKKKIDCYQELTFLSVTSLSVVLILTGV